MDFIEPRDLAELHRTLDTAGEDARVVAGGVALGIMMRWGFLRPALLVSVRYLSALRFIRLDAQQGLRIGAATTHHEIETSPLIREQAPALAELEQGLASVQVRNSGTLGGNLCHADPAADPAPLLLALATRLVLSSSRGSREIGLEDFFTGYLTTALGRGEILTELVVPPAAPRSGAAYLKHSVRNAVDFPFAGVAAQVTLDKDRERCASARVAYGAVGPTARLSRDVPARLAGERLSDALLDEAARLAGHEVEPPDDAAGSAAYRRHLVGVLTRRALVRATQRARDAGGRA